MPVQLTRAQIDETLPRVETGLGNYQWLQQQFFNDKNVHVNAIFRRKFNHFYRVRRNAEWQESYFTLMGRARREVLQFSTMLNALRQATNRLEASFASKLIATIDPSAPVIDKFVLKNVGLALPGQYISNREEIVIRVYANLQDSFAAYLKTEVGQYLVREFGRLYPNSGVTEVKMLDLVLWQTRT